MTTRTILLATALLAMLGDGRAEARGCTDPNDCSSTNGHGVYFEEAGLFLGGSAQLDATSGAMITHFINNGSSVSFQARFQTSYGTWTTGTGHVYGADYAGNRYSVSQIWAYAPGTLWPSYLYWRLTDDSTGSSFWVGGANLYNLALHLFTPGQALYTLTFHPVSSALFPEAGVHGTSAYQYDVIVHPGETAGATGSKYCMRADGVADTAVFQTGIDVDPVNGAVSAAANHVTMSCRHGAPAQAYLWGYDYVTYPWHFASAINMKRASYCGDGSYFTNAGTTIGILDNEHIQTGMVTDGNLEALWTPTGAGCYVPSRMRHTELRFTGSCLGKASIPICSATELQSAIWWGGAFLGDAGLP